MLPRDLPNDRGASAIPLCRCEGELALISHMSSLHHESCRSSGQHRASCKSVADVCELPAIWRATSSDSAKMRFLQLHIKPFSKKRKRKNQRTHWKTTCAFKKQKRFVEQLIKTIYKSGMVGSITESRRHALMAEPENLQLRVIADFVEVSTDASARTLPRTNCAWARAGA